MLAVSFTLCYFRWFAHATSSTFDRSILKQPVYPLEDPKVDPAIHIYLVAPRRGFGRATPVLALTLEVARRASLNPPADINTAWRLTSSMELDLFSSELPGSPKSCNGIFFGLGPTRLDLFDDLLLCQFLVSFMLCSFVLIIPLHRK